MKKLNMFRRCLIFSTFFTCLLGGALVCAALAGGSWVSARVSRPQAAPPSEDRGRVTFGLFHGRKELNPGYGWRRLDFSVMVQVRGEAELLHPAAWLAVVSLCALALCLHGVAAMASAVNTAAAPRCTKPLIIFNSLAMLADLGAVAVWMVEFYTKIQYNVLPPEDLANKWSTEDMADFGRCFWFVVAAAVISALNIICINIALADDRDKDPVMPMIEEKTNGAIMLY